MPAGGERKSERERMRNGNCIGRAAAPGKKKRGHVRDRHGFGLARNRNNLRISLFRLVLPLGTRCIHFFPRLIVPPTGFLPCVHIDVCSVLFVVNSLSLGWLDCSLSVVVFLPGYPRSIGASASEINENTQPSFCCFEHSLLGF